MTARDDEFTTEELKDMSNLDLSVLVYGVALLTNAEGARVLKEVADRLRTDPDGKGHEHGS